MPRNNRLYIIGYCHNQKDIRTFRLNRFQNIDVLSQKFVRDHISLEKYLRYTWSVIRGDQQIHINVKFNKDIARYIKEDDYNVPPKMSELPDGSLLFEITLNDDREFLKWVMQYGPDAEILEPEIYREWMKKRLQIWSKLYED